MSDVRTTLITGGNSGIGEALARKLVEKGQRVISLGLEKPGWTHDLLHAYQVDLTNIEQTRGIAQAICRYNEIDHLVHNAGMILPNLLPDAKAEDILTLAQLHLGAPMILTQAALEGMQERSFGRIVFVSSRASMGGGGHADTFGIFRNQGGHAWIGADLGPRARVQRNHRERRRARTSSD